MKKNITLKSQTNFNRNKSTDSGAYISNWYLIPDFI